MELSVHFPATILVWLPARVAKPFSATVAETPLITAWCNWGRLGGHRSRCSQWTPPSAAHRRNSSPSRKPYLQVEARRWTNPSACDWRTTPSASEVDPRWSLVDPASYPVATSGGRRCGWGAFAEFCGDGDERRGWWSGSASDFRRRRTEWPGAWISGE